jgi:hypothetical protein
MASGGFSDMQNLSAETKWTMYAALNVAFGALLVIGATIGGGSLAELPYVVLMFAICSSPIPFIGHLNGPFAILGVALATYFLNFAMLDAVSMLSPPKLAHATEGFLDAGELVLLVGALMQTIGFHVAVRFSSARAGGLPKDWPLALLVPLGLLLWSSGCAADLYQNLVVHVDATDASVKAGFSKLGPWGIAGLMLVNYAGPLGVVILAYWWAVSRNRWSSALMLAIIVIQFAVGWVVDTKEVAVNAPIVMLLTRFIVLGKVPVRWLACSVVGILLVFPVLTAKRAITTEALRLTNVQALSRTGEILLRAISERNEAREGKYSEKTQSFLERMTNKASVELFVQHVGVDQPYKMGSTLVSLLYVFVPRIVFSDKPGGNSAQTFNRDFHLSEDPDTYISPSHIGELYWNFGYPGVVVGMTLSGMILGFIFARFDPSVRTSLTRVLVIMVTLYELVARTGGQIELEYVLWLRTLLLIGILHLVLARPVRQEAFGPISRANPSARRDGPPGGLVRFPNLMR